MPFLFLKPVKKPDSPLRFLLGLIELYLYLCLFIVVHNVVGMNDAQKPDNSRVFSSVPLFVVWYGPFTFLVIDWMQSGLFNRNRIMSSIVRIGMCGLFIISLWIGLIVLSTYIATK